MSTKRKRKLKIMFRSYNGNYWHLEGDELELLVDQNFSIYVDGNNKSFWFVETPRETKNFPPTYNAQKCE